MNFGQKLKELRQKKSITQEQLANALHVSSQAVSKWENELSMPDIQMLPEISVFFGVTIDELFDMNKDAHYSRIETMLSCKHFLEKEDIAYVEKFLKERLDENANDARAEFLFAELYNHIADNYREKARKYAVSYLEKEPEDKDGHNALRQAEQGTIPDWNIANHHKRISYYQDFVKKNPDYVGGYLWLLDELIADGRLTEAKDTLHQMKHVCNDYRVPLYEGKIEWADGAHKNAKTIWKEMEEKYAKEWLVPFVIGDEMVRDGQYEEAIAYYKKAMEQQPKPRYTDAPMAMAHIYEIQGDITNAILCWEEVIAILQDEWNYKEEEIFEAPREIARLKEM